MLALRMRREGDDKYHETARELFAVYERIDPEHADHASSLEEMLGRRLEFPLLNG